MGARSNSQDIDLIRYMRLLRIEHGISVKEFAEAAGVSQQYISSIELGRYDCKITARRLLMMQAAFEKVIEQRIERARRLSEAYAGSRNRLLDPVTEDFHEL